MHVRPLGLFLGMILMAPPVFGWTVDLEKSRVPITELAGPWRFQTGDDSTWSNPAFDDSLWPLIRTDKGWSDQGYIGYHGTAWYRLEIQLPAQHAPLSLYIPNVDVSCQVYAHGRLIGQKGDLPPHPRWVTQTRMIFPIPEDAANAGRLILAIRVWNDSAVDDVVALHTFPGGLNPAPLLGDTHSIAQLRNLESHDLYWRSSSTVIELFANLFSGLASLGIFALRRKEREYLWFGIYILAWAAYESLELYSSILSAPYYAIQNVEWFLFGVGLCTFIEFLATLFELGRRRAYAGGLLFGALGVAMAAADTLQPGYGWRIGFGLGLPGWHICQILLLYRARKAGLKEANVLLAAVAVSLGQDTIYFLNNIPFLSRLAWEQWLLNFLARGIQWPFPYFVPNLTGDLTNLAVLVVLIRRYARIRQEEERIESELEAARTVQKILIPDEIPALPGFNVEAVYKPASQVGGDFFQIVPVRPGGAMIAIGDVSGKRMPAAMTVSLLVGTFRTLAHYTQNPGEILCAMNRLMLSRTGGGFTTCLVLRAEPDERLVAANAGHLAPYINGEEVEVDSGLPLGLAPDSKYPETQIKLRAHGHLTLITDGVPEARDTHGELFGFDRTASVVHGTADTVAAAAQRFGQSDDITVVRLSLAPVDAN
jgi:Stage II sporulation protein E (SpoIIE)